MQIQTRLAVLGITFLATTLFPQISAAEVEHSNDSSVVVCGCDNRDSSLTCLKILSDGQVGVLGDIKTSSPRICAAQAYQFEHSRDSGESQRETSRSAQRVSRVECSCQQRNRYIQLGRKLVCNVVLQNDARESGLFELNYSDFEDHGSGRMVRTAAQPELDRNCETAATATTARLTELFRK
jgi:hypothetical protein